MRGSRDVQSIELHGFADASERAYAAVVYLRSNQANSGVVISLVAKSKVAPLKQVSLPRLELCAATLLAQLIAYTNQTLSLQKADTHAWLDSTVALSWVQGHPSRWKTYVANRVAEVQRLTPEVRWHHVRDTDNPADCASRGLSPRDLMQHNLWWQGPSWLSSARESWPNSAVPTSLTEELPEQRRTAAGLAQQEEVKSEFLLRYSSLTRLLRITAWCKRKVLHGGVQQTLGLLRQRFWVLQKRSAVKRHIYQCVTCVRWRAATQQQMMANLPRPRVTPARPFQHTGVDYAGPIMLRTTPGRGHKAYKAFVVVFICLSTKAVHLDAASDYSADAFLATFRRFTSRRGLCQALYSDCGTNFIGADSQLRSMFSAGSKEEQDISRQLVAERVQWHFNPPSAPHFGGIWKAAIKSMKHHIRRVVGETTLTYEEMATLLAQVEACLNSRPLQALNDDPEDLSALTPLRTLFGGVSAECRSGKVFARENH